MAIDNVMLGVLNAYFRAAAEAAGFTLKRSAHTTYVKESNDFTTALITPDGEQFAYPVALAAQSYVGINYSTFIASCAPWRDGDIAVSNCPYLTKGVATHLPDYHMLKPIFSGDRLIAFAWCFIHSSDMGGIVAGSILPSAYELYQEGIRIPPKKLYRAGVLQEDVRDFMLANVRIPDKNWGDLNAMVAALGTADQRVKAAVGKWGVETVVEGQQALIGYAEARARALIDRLPEGTWHFHDYLEDDVISDIPVRVKLAVTKSAGGDIHLDYSGSDPQIGAAFNLPSAGHHPFLCGGLLGFFRTMDPTVPINGGLLRPIRITAPEGSIVNCTFPAAVGVRYAINQLNYGIVQAILAQALPGEIPAAGAAQATILAISIMDSATGRRRASVIQPMIGGSGARPMKDGIDATDFSLGALANTPTESIENEVSILIHHYGVVPDSGGPGQFRGGLAARLDFEVFQPDSILTARGMDRFVFQPWGLNGGRPGAKGDAWLNPGTPQAKRLGKITMLRLNLGEVLSIRSPTGGGFGDPLERSAAAVLNDVRSGYVTARSARDDYGVVVANDEVDTAATAALRNEMHAIRASAPRREMVPGEWPAMFDGGVGRATHDRTLPPVVADRMVELLYSIPPAARYYAKQQLFARLREIPLPEARGLSREDLEAVWTELRPRLGLRAEA
jgi:N-methylhydantoinase B